MRNRRTAILILLPAALVASAMLAPAVSGAGGGPIVPAVARGDVGIASTDGGSRFVTFDGERGTIVARIEVGSGVVRAHRLIERNGEVATEAQVRAADLGSAAADLPGAPLSDEIGAALAELDPERRAVVVLRYLLEFTPGEIAETLGIPRGTVNSRLRRTLDELGERLREEGA